MKRIGVKLCAAIISCAAILSGGCAGSQPSAPSSSASAANTCTRGTLGIEASPISRQVRKTLALAEGLKGAVVVEVLPGGPAAAAGIRPNDIVEEVGTAQIGNDCEFVDAAYYRACSPLRVVLWRAGATVEVTLVPVEQDAFFEKGCADRVASACFRQGWLLWNRNQGVDRERATGLYDKACNAGSSEACAYEGLHLIDSATRSSNAVPVLERSCELGSGGGCATFAFLYATGRLAKKDDRRATALYVKACDLGDAQGCYNAGLMTDEGRGTPGDSSRAAARYEEGCELGSSTGCTNLGFLYENGHGVKKDSKRAVALYQRGCDGSRCQPSNLGGCVNAGRAYRDGIGVEKDEARAASIFREACDRKPNADDIHADENRSRACSLLRGLYLAGDGIAQGLAKGRELSELGCEQGDSFGCFNAAAVFAAGSGVEKNPAKATHYLELACKAGDAEGCYDLGVAYEKGNGVARDHRRGAGVVPEGVRARLSGGLREEGALIPSVASDPGDQLRVKPRLALGYAALGALLGLGGPAGALLLRVSFKARTHSPS